MEVTSTQQTTNNLFGSSTEWGHVDEVIEQVSPQRTRQHGSPVGSQRFSPHEKTEAGASVKSTLQATVELDVSSRGASAEVEVEMIASDGPEDLKSLAALSASPL
jgi:hypothetical protein